MESRESQGRFVWTIWPRRVSKASLMALSANEWPLPWGWSSHTSVFRDHVSDEAEDSLLERWTKLGEAVLANGVPTEAHITEMTALARSEQDQIKRKLRRTGKFFRHSQSKH